ncbi:MAG: Trm112 family protein [Ferrimonas sp.]
MAFDHKLLEIMACPVCKGKLEYDRDGQRLLCRADKLAFAIDDGIPVLLEVQAQPLESENS